MTQRRRTTRLLAAALLLVATTSGCATADSASSSTAQKSASAYTELGMGYLAQGQSERAASAFQRALAHTPDEAAALHGMALLEQRAGNAEQSAKYYEQTLRALEQHPNNPDNQQLAEPQVRNNYASLLYEQGKLNAACSQLAQAAGNTHYSGRAGILVNLSQCQLRVGQSEASHQTLLEAGRIAPNLPLVMLASAYDSFTRGDLANARRQLERYRRQAGNSRDAQVLAKALDEQPPSVGQ